MSGPSAALAVTVSVILAGGVGVAELAIIVIMAGAFQTLFGVFGIGRIVSYIPHVVRPHRATLCICAPGNRREIVQ